MQSLQIYKSQEKHTDGLTSTNDLLNLDKGNIDFLGKFSHCLIRVFVGERVDINLDPFERGDKQKRGKWKSRNVTEPWATESPVTLKMISPMWMNCKSELWFSVHVLDVLPWPMRYWLFLSLSSGSFIRLCRLQVQRDQYKWNKIRIAAQLSEEFMFYFTFFFFGQVFLMLYQPNVMHINHLTMGLFRCNKNNTTPNKAMTGQRSLQPHALLKIHHHSYGLRSQHRLVVDSFVRAVNTQYTVTCGGAEYRRQPIWFCSLTQAAPLKFCWCKLIPPVQ